MAKKATIQYRQLKTEGLPGGINLQNLLVEVLRRPQAGGALATNAKLRIIDIDQDQSFVILNKLSDPGSWDGPFFAAQIIHLQEGADVHAVLQSLDEDTIEFVVENLDVGQQARVVKGVLYFAAVGNHVGLIEGHQVRGRTLERYLTAFLQHAGNIDPGQAVILNGQFMTGDGKELSESSEVTVSAVPNRGSEAPAPRTPSGMPRTVEREAASAREEGATVFDVLRVLGWNEEALASLEAEVPDDGWIEGLFRFVIKQKNRRKPVTRATINEALRNIDPADIGLRGDGSEKGGIVKLSMQRTVQEIGSLLDPSDAMQQIVNALRDWATAGKIDCTFEP